MKYESINPNTEQSIVKFESIGDGELESVIDVAHGCYGIWRSKTFAERAEVVMRASHLLEERAYELAHLASLEMGKRINEALAEVTFSARILAYYAKNAEHFLRDVKLNPEAGLAHIESSPIGIIFCVEPWNFPYYQLARVSGPQLMAGNVIMVKHASIIPQCALAFEKIWIDAGAPLGTYTNLFISHSQADQVLDDARIKGLAVTGSVEAGQKLAARAGKNIKTSTMELGGSDAFIVLDDADIDAAVKWAVWGRMYNAGQTCCAAKRFIVQEAVAEEFLTKFKLALSALRAGDPSIAATTQGPLSSEAALLQLIESVNAAVQHGAKIELGGKRIDCPGWFMEPTILTNVEPDNPAFRHEFFGPVAMFFVVNDDDSAIALANDSDFGLGGSVYSKNAERAQSIASRVDTGMMFINNIDWSDAELPFGGIKDSGYGRELGYLGIQHFVNKKLVRTHSIEAPQ
ncbi:NAD-dependent succinate-semialdehyde dehydrogenase [Sapientia aquatica]|uniref:NAD-dependent succinate-semialdehyde dehydrogenase n=1 Tax=Sapientia aquatica TaxID=1549640 RepID=A0A4R5W2W8_9BURK|nr:NAD-dependent succinate-semialdehyde dehydrogenase [Sapientia aquatica]TDK67084.1 NAD-dependent succinate-semialdehyde dehydrogenase [Sapientia aquatica]